MKQKHKNKMDMKRIADVTADIKENIFLTSYAHNAEDEIHREFIKHVARYAKDKELAEMARAILKIGNLNFGRWCAS